jgi:hypothetical protein
VVGAAGVAGNANRWSTLCRNSFYTTASQDRSLRAVRFRILESGYDQLQPVEREEKFPICGSVSENE